MKAFSASYYRVALAAGILMTAACQPSMTRQPKNETLSASDFFSDGASARPLVPGTLPQNALLKADPLASGSRDGKLVEKFPLPLTMPVLERGRQRFDIYCSACHGLTGEGDGMAVRRGFPAPPSFFEERLQTEPIGHFFDVITDGAGTMYSYGDRVGPADRWAIIAYIRALQLSRSLHYQDLVPGERSQLPPAGGGRP